MQKHKIAVVGAGPAGLLAAYRLKQAGIEVKVFEARSRIGGRLFSDAKRMIEFGAWSLGDGGNIDYVTSIAKELDLEILDGSMPFPGIAIKGDRGEDMTERFKEVVGEDSQATKAKLVAIIDSSKTIQDVLDSFFQDHPDLKAYCETLSWLYHGSAAGDISAHLYKEGIIELCMGGVSDIYKHEASSIPLYRIKGGNDLLVKRLAEKLKESIELDKPLTLLCKDKNGKIKLTFAGGSQEDADYVILALPVGAYRSLEVLDKVISKEQLDGIAQTCPGTISKVLLPALGRACSSGFYIGDGHSAGKTADEKYVTMHWARQLEMDVVKEKVALVCSLLDLPVPKEFIIVNDAKLDDYPQDAVLIIDWPHAQFTQGSYCAFSPTQDQHVRFEDVNGVMVNALFKPTEHIYFASEAASVTAGTGSVGAAFESAEIASKLLIQRLEL